PGWLAGGPRRAQPGPAGPRGRRQASRWRAGALPPEAGRPAWANVRRDQVPDDDRRRRGAPGRAPGPVRGPRTGVQDRERPADDVDRADAAPDEPRRAAPVLERAPRRDEPRRPAPGASVR